MPLSHLLMGAELSLGHICSTNRQDIDCLYGEEKGSVTENEGKYVL